MHEHSPTPAMSVTATDPKFSTGGRLVNGRLHLEQALGRGGMGVVYRAFDSVRRGHVAVKTMHELGGASIYALKNEFRSLTDLHHPNLVRLFELFGEDERWFFTMELITGEHVDTWVRPEGRFDEARVRATFGQLIDAIETLHSHGKLHCDIKPSNALVTERGHVVVLDFGLVTEPIANGIGQTVTGEMITGTPAYLAPELGLGLRPTAASDAYALGVMLFQALTGELPFDGMGAEVLVAKQRGRIRWPAELQGRLPNDLVEVCEQLLVQEPAARPLLPMVRTRIAGETQRSWPSWNSTPVPANGELFGRTIELKSMRDAYAASLAGRAVVLSVEGESGIGKSALCNAFLDDLIARGHTTVLRGRCNERESVPFKAVDALIDSLSRRLRRMSKLQIAELLPRDTPSLVRLFPVLGRVEMLARAPERTIAEPHAEQRRGFEALHELLCRVRDRSPLVVFIDDLQWTDRDSGFLLRHVLGHSEVPPALFILSHRGQSHPNPLLDSILETAASNRAVSLCHTTLEPLSSEAAAALAEHVLAGCQPTDRARMQRVHQEAQGSPFLIREFARFAAESPECEMLSLGAAISARVASLSEASRRLLSLLAVAGHPLPLEFILDAARATHGDIDTLQTMQLVRWSNSEKRRLELYHDRIGESLREILGGDETTRVYGHLARASEGRSDVDADMQCAYLEGAGEREAAYRRAEQAAREAEASLAFDHAAELYEKALELGRHAIRNELELAKGWARALANAGRSAKAATAYRRAALLADGDERRDLQRRCAEQLFFAGHVKEGSALLSELCSCAKVGRPWFAYAELAYLFGRLRLAGLPRPGRPSAATSKTDVRLELLGTANYGLRYDYANKRAADITVAYLREALRHRDVWHVTCALSSVAIHLESITSSEAVLAYIQHLAESDGRPQLFAALYWSRGFLARRSGHNRQARVWFARTSAACKECVGMQWLVDMIRVFDQAAANACGDYAELARTTAGFADEAFQHGRVWTGVALSGFWGMPAWLTHDDVSGYGRQLERARNAWGDQASSHTTDRAAFELHRAIVMLTVYRRQPLEGVRQLAQSGSVGVESFYRPSSDLLLGLCNAAVLGGARTGQFAIADAAHTRQLVHDISTKLTTRSTRPFAHVLRAACALERRAEDDAVRELGSAVELFESLSMAMLAAGARRRLGELLGGAEGASLVAAANAAMRAQGIVNTEAFTELLCPGCEPG